MPTIGPSLLCRTRSAHVACERVRTCISAANHPLTSYQMRKGSLIIQNTT
jgi:hypothetical protein